jgi:phosphotriesterase-related protein
VTRVPIVGGEIDATEMGATLMHEHIFLRTPELQEAWPGFGGWDDDAAVATAREKLGQLKQSGIDTIVDMTAPGLGRNIGLIRRAVAGIGLQVIVVTGYYTFTTLPWPLQLNGPGRLFNSDDTEDALLVDLFVRDVHEGIEGTDIRAGAIKCSTDEPGVTDDVERLIRAVGRAHLRTGAPIMTHSHAGSRRGLDQQRILREEGVDLSHVLIGHSNETADVDYCVELIEAGSYLGFDRCGLKLFVPIETQLETLVALCERGYADRIVLSHDVSCAADWWSQEDIRAALPEWHYGYIQQTLIPDLLERGVTEDQIDRMIRQNPVDFFSAR